MSVVVAGVDPGFVNFGVAVAAMPERSLLHASCEFLTRDRWHWGARIEEVFSDLHARYGLDFLVMEDPAVIHEKCARGARRKTTVSVDATLGNWCSALLTADWCRRNGVQIIPPIPPRVIKAHAASAVGSGRSWETQPSKAEMVAWAKRLYSVDDLENDHAADAALAILVGYHGAHARSVPA